MLCCVGILFCQLLGGDNLSFVVIIIVLVFVVVVVVVVVVAIWKDELVLVLLFLYYVWSLYLLFGLYFFIMVLL